MRRALHLRGVPQDRRTGRIAARLLRRLGCCQLVGVYKLNRSMLDPRDQGGIGDV
jgi:hypothetical protein